MNYLAHAYLSFHQPEILVGNMISDFVKGKKKFDYLPDIQKGIELHRAIDTFTDFHPATKEAKVYLQPAVGTYAGAFIDVVYDHFLANDAAQFSPNTLAQTAANTYSVLNQFMPHLPTNFQMMLPYMETQNWLANYASLQGIEKSFGGVVRRAAYLNSSREVFELFRQHYNTLQKCYNLFFPDVKTYAANYLQQLLIR